MGGIALIDHQIEKLLRQGFDQIVVNVHHKADQLIRHLQKWNTSSASIYLSDESDRLLDTGGGLKRARSFFDTAEPILIHNVDILSEIDLSLLYRTHIREKNDATLAVSGRATSRYLMFDTECRLRGWINRTTGETKSIFPDFKVEEYHPWAFGGIHLIAPALLNEMDHWGDSFSIIDFYLSLCDRYCIKACNFTGIDWFDVGKPATLQEAEQWYQSKKRNATF